MPLRTLLRFRNPDSTDDLNTRFKGLVSKGIFSGGEVTPIPGSLEVDVALFAAMGADGMVTLLEGTSEQLTVIAGATQRVVGRFIYSDNSAPTASLEVLTEANYLIDPDIDSLITFARITIPLGATDAVGAVFDTTVADWIDPVSRNAVRGLVDTYGSLPADDNRDRDLYFVEDEAQWYYWDETGSSWDEVVDTSILTTLTNHINNEDALARHVTPDIQEALENPASGTALGAGNPVVDSALPYARRVIEEFDVAGVRQIQLTGRYFIGFGTAPTATLYFATTQVNDVGDSDYIPLAQQPVVGTDDGVITVLGIYPFGTGAPGTPSTPASPGPGTLVVPSADADSEGFITDPIIRFNFERTTDTSYTGKLNVLAFKAVTLGATVPQDQAEPLILYPTASLVPVSPALWGLMAGTNAQDALDSADTAIQAEAAARAAADLLAQVYLLTQNNVWTGDQTWQKSFLGLGTTLIGNVANALIPRIQANPRNVTADLTLLWESKAAVGVGAMRMYVKGDGELSFTTNARWDGTNWYKDDTGEDATRLRLSTGNLYFEYSTGLTVWTAWTAHTTLDTTAGTLAVGGITTTNDVTVGNDLTVTGNTSGPTGAIANMLIRRQLAELGNDLLASDANGLLARLSGAARALGTEDDYILLMEFGQGSEKYFRAYVSPTGRLILTTNASYDGSVWNKDVNGEEAHAIELGSTTVNVLFIGTATNSWADGGWAQGDFRAGAATTTSLTTSLVTVTGANGFGNVVLNNDNATVGYSSHLPYTSQAFLSRSKWGISALGSAEPQGPSLYEDFNWTGTGQSAEWGWVAAAPTYSESFAELTVSQRLVTLTRIIAPQNHPTFRCALGWDDVTLSDTYEWGLFNNSVGGDLVLGFRMSTSDYGNNNIRFVVRTGNPGPIPSTIQVEDTGLNPIAYGKPLYYECAWDNTTAIGYWSVLTGADSFTPLTILSNDPIENPDTKLYVQFRRSGSSDGTWLIDMVNVTGASRIIP